jgi:heptosyltransferase-2
MAAAVGVPTVTIFGPTSPVAWSPGLATTLVVRDERVPCLGCRHDVCPIGHDCMHGVTPEMVMQRVRALLQHAARRT